MERHTSIKPKIALEEPRLGKYVARLLRSSGLSVHLTDTVKHALLYNSPKKNDTQDSYKLPKLLKLRELPEVHLPSENSGDLKSLVRYGKPFGEEVKATKNRVHFVLSVHDFRIDATDIFRRKRMKETGESFLS